MKTSNSGRPMARSRHPAGIRCSPLLLALLFCWLCLPAAADVKQWTGAVSANWSNPNNWSPAGAPQNLDSLRFDGGGNRTMLNDIPGLTVREMTFLGSDFTLNGNPITLTNNTSPVLWITGNGGTITLNCAFVLASAGLVQVWPFLGDSGTMRFNADLNLTGHVATLDSFSPGGGGDSRIQMAGSISGAGDVRVESSDNQHGIVEFLGSADNTFSGTLIVRPHVPYASAGTFFNKSAGSVVTNRLDLQNAVSVIWRNANQIGDHATVAVSEGSRLDLDGYDETIGTLVLTNVHADAGASMVDTVGSAFGPPMGTLTVNDGIVASVDNDSVLPIIQGVVNLPAGFHSFFVYASGYAGLDFPAQIIGGGGFSKFGNAALLLKGTNTFGGTVYSREGIIDVYNPAGFGSPAGGVVLSGGSVTLRNLTIASEALTVQGQEVITTETSGSLLFSVGAGAWTGSIQLNTNLVVGGGDMVLTGPISGGGGLDFRTFGTAELGGSVANTFTGTTLVRCPLLQLNKSLGVNAYAGPLVVGGGNGGPCEVRWLNFYQTPSTALTVFANGIVNLNNQVDDFGPVTFNGGLIETFSGSFIAGYPITANVASSTALITGNLALSVTPAQIIVSNGIAEPDLRIDAVISGADLRKLGQGTLTFTAPNTYSGYTSVEDGILQADNSAAFGSTLGNTIVGAAATVRLGLMDGMPEAFQLNGTGFQGTNGALQVTVGGTLSGGVFLSSPSTINVLQTGSLAINSVVSGTGPLTKTGPGNLYLGGVSGGAGNNNYTGGTIVSMGTLYLSKNNNIIAAPGQLTVGPAPDASQVVVRFVHSGMMSFGGMATVNLNSLLDLNGNNQTLSQLNLNDGGDVQTRSGILSLTPGAVIATGTLNPPKIGLRASASISGTLELPNFDLMNFNVAPYSDTMIVTTTPELDVPANIFGFGDIHKNGPGRLRLRGNNTFNNSPPTSAGNVQVLGGTLIAASATALGGTGGVTLVSTAGTLVLDGGITINGEPLSLSSTNAPGLLSLSGANTWTGDIRLFRDSMVGVNNGSSLLINGTVFGSGSLTKIGPGTLTLGGLNNNTYSGDTFANEGTTVLDKAASSGTTTVPHHITVGTGQPGNAATLLENDENCIAGSVTVNSGSLWTLNASESFSDGEIQSHAPLTLNGNCEVQIKAGFLFLPPGGGVVVNPGTNTTATISGPVALTSLIAGPTTHPITVNAGSLQTAAECVINGGVDQVFGVFGLQKGGAGTLHLTGTNTYTGTNLVKGGTFWVDGLQPQSAVHLDSGTRLKGSGTVGDINLIGNSATIAPGASAGILTCSNFNALASGSGTLEIELNGTTPGSGYDQINARGTVNLGGLSLIRSLNFSSAVGNSFVLINNDGTDPVTNTFAGLPQNAKLYAGDQLFQINYSGGSGNDVVLTRLVTPPPPTLTIERVPPASVRLIWPTNDPPFSLQSITNLIGATWMSATSAPVVLDANNVITNAAADPNRFYRLVSP